MTARRPLTHAQVGERATKALLRVWRALQDVRENVDDPELTTAVRVHVVGSGVARGLADELALWLDSTPPLGVGHVLAVDHVVETCPACQP